MSDSNLQYRRRRISFGEIIALAALAVSAFGVWVAWKSSSDDKPTRIVEQRQAIPLTLRGKVDDGGRTLEISPVEPGHALEWLKVMINGASIEVGSDGRLDASDVEAVLKNLDEKKGDHTSVVRLDARYVDAGADRRGGGNYVLRYRWEGGGLLGGRSLRLTGLARG
jgi:hypothetical protein